MTQQSYSVVRRSFSVSGVDVSYQIYTKNVASSSERLVLLHGAGVAGELTWSAIVEHLDHWGQILVPDLRGMGETRHLDGSEYAFTVQEVCDDVVHLLDQLGWWRFDLGGYSFGGLIAMLLKQRNPSRVGQLYLLEPALLDRADINEVRSIRERYSEAAQHIRQQHDPSDGIRLFLDTIAPGRNRSDKTESMTISRLAERPLGFANALDSVTRSAHEVERDQLLEHLQHAELFAGGRSVRELHDHYLHLARQNTMVNYHEVKGTDHSLPYQKPRQIARLMNEARQRYTNS
ncbi:alpha/beta hydrolase [Pokkaliibacter plantistimulans]|uniref:Alpha/beta hydrolase n=1 Tax=Proteobacteria bacterium 228 TaxID=2083153 RepID=A0A2S5KXG8_9PROT|nr:alpha/beta hydrolase [Pokkaliibacter plantistimulans]PPC79405.1 alpha/beta hydrolase [Pokkaliibacter plantistimulans]